VSYVELIQLQTEQVFANKEEAAAWLNKPNRVGWENAIRVLKQ
jgi:hypothetical protein